MSEIFFYNFSGRNQPDYSKTDFNTMYAVDGVILRTGRHLPRPETAINSVDLGGAVVLPAFADAHVHFTQTGITLMGCRFDAATSINEVTDAIKAEADKNYHVLGWGLQEVTLKERRLPTLEELDRACPDNFVWLARKDLHSAVVNSHALEWARSFFPSLRTEKGLIKAEEYNFLCYQLNSQLSAEFKKQALKMAEQEGFKKGVATVHALEGSLESTDDTLALSDFLETSPLHGVIYHQSPDPTLPLQKGWNRMGGCLLVDGSIGTRTAAMHEPYADAPGNLGNLYLSAEKIEQLLKTAHDNNLQLALHAIGDRALDTVTACHTWASERLPATTLPHRIEHFILPSDKAIRSVRKNSTMICVQPAFDHFWGGPSGLYAQRLGAKRAESCNPFKTLLSLGILLAGGSDSPVTPIDPLLGVKALVTHSNPEEQISLNQALSLFISEPHKLAGEEKFRGHLRTGYRADFVCLAGDPCTTPPAELSSLKITDLYIGAQKVY